MKRYSLVIITILYSAIFLSGCVSQKEVIIKQGYPLAYADGFDDGCHSGRKAGGNSFDQFKKDVKRFQKDSQYSQGWSDGFRQCETEQEALDRQLRMTIEQQHLMEARKRNELEGKRYLETEILKGVDTRGLENLK